MSLEVPYLLSLGPHFGSLLHPCSPEDHTLGVGEVGVANCLLTSLSPATPEALSLAAALEKLVEDILVKGQAPEHPLFTP